MREASELGMSFNQVLDSYEDVMLNARREWAARLLTLYPRHEELQVAVNALRKALHSHKVQINSVFPSIQVTVAEAPVPRKLDQRPVRESLCALTVSVGEPLMVSDVQHDDFLHKHVTVPQGLGSWASAPIFLQGCAAGSICALESKRRRSWNDADQETLEGAARQIGNLIDEWVPFMDPRLLV